MRNIVIVDPVSTGYNYVQDVISRGYNPIVLQSTIDESTEEGKEFKKMVEEEIESIEHDFEWIHEEDTYEKTLEIIKGYEPLLVIPGTEQGVILATKLANDLDLLCNPIENLDAMTLKHEMHNRLAKHNLRHIRGQVITSVEEAVKFYDEENLNEVVVKPIYSAGSAGVRICLNKEEMINSIKELSTKTNLYGNRLSELLVQERINGEEYFVNTVSCDGNHRVTLIWKYRKVKTAEGGMIYDTIETVNELNLGEAEMVEYAYKVADAIGIRYGPVHGEYMIDDDGPVLIEVNCRPSGCHMDADYLDRISGQHETDSVLDSYLKPERFHEEKKKRYRLYAHGALKLLITPKNLLADSAPLRNISIKLKSHYKTALDDTFDTKEFIKTEDLESSSGIIYLVNEDYFELTKDIEFLRKVEKMAFDLVLSEKSIDKIEIDETECISETKSLMSKIENYGTTLLVTDQKLDDAHVQVNLGELEGIQGKYDCVVVNLNKSLVEIKEDEIARIFLEVFTKVKVGGLIFIPESTYQNIKSKRRGMEALLKTLNLRLELPPQGVDGIIIASKT
ncbi:ATP-grasp domain-containing protein [Methanobrevibacter sp.]|uniref:ATP-grasp domain-containing protein n=1 Tax=Methanobrevibacter sp. TaxID=66852 RepID=UPI0025FA89C3|nr:ATP-grasp domain-containing protein [Methanobrevibacter sp.]MBQ6512085.1 ATP-grasp domain-containing protein [Methanobrevibacter sp.]